MGFRSAVDIPAALVSDIGAALVSDFGAELQGADCSQMALGPACRKAADIEVVDTAELAGYSHWAGHRHRRHGGTFLQTCARRLAETVPGSHTESVQAGSSLAEGNSAEGSLAVDTAGSFAKVDDTVGRAAEGSHCSELGWQPCTR